MYVFIVAAVLAWVLLALVLPYWVVPYMRKEPLPTRFPRALEVAAGQLSDRCETPYAYIKQAVLFVLSHNHAGRLQGLVFWRQVFKQDMQWLAAHKGFLHENHLNHLLRVLLSKSAFFSDEDIRFRYTLLNLRLHVYLQVQVAGQWYDVDVAAYWRGKRLGTHAWGLG